MFEPLCVERVPSRIQSVTACMAFGRDPDSSSACWSSCTVTSAFDLHFHRAFEGPHRQVPGAREKKKTPQFFRFSCPAALSLVPSDFIPAHVLSCAFSARSETSGCAIAAALPTVAMLLRPPSMASLLLLLHPLRSDDGTVTYAVSSYPAPDSAQRVLLAYDGGTVVLLETYPAHCYAMRSGDAALRRVPIQYDQSLRGRVVWASARPPLRESCGVLLEVLLLTDQAVVAAVNIRTDGLALSGRCVWDIPLIMTEEVAYADKDAKTDVQGLLERWDTTVTFTRDVNAPLPLLKYRDEADAERTKNLFLVSPVVCASENGAVLCVIPRKRDEAFIIAIGSNDDDPKDIENHRYIDNVHGNGGANEKRRLRNVGDASVSVALPTDSLVRDAVWTGDGFVLLGSTLLFLPLVGRLRCVARSDVVDTTTSILSHRNTTDMFGAVRLRMALRCVDAATGTLTIRVSMLSLPNTRQMALSPQRAFWLMRFTGLISFNSKSNSTSAQAPLSAPNHVDPHAGVIQPRSIDLWTDNTDANALRHSMEVSLDAPPAPFSSAVFPLRAVLDASLASLLGTLQRPRLSSAAAAKALAVLRAAFAGAAAALADAAVPSSAPLLLRWLPALHGVLTAMRRALLRVARRGALSAVFACAWRVAALADESPRALPHWRTLAAPLADDAVAMLASCPSLARALVPHCSAPVRAVIALADVAAKEPVDTVDIPGVAQQILLTEGSGAVKEFLRSAGGDAKSLSLCAGNDSIERMLVPAYSVA